MNRAEKEGVAPEQDPYVIRALERGGHGDYLVINTRDVGVPHGEPHDLRAKELAAGLDMMLHHGWRYVSNLSPDLLVFERADRHAVPGLIRAVSNMHRRAQHNEGAAHQLDKRQAGFERQYAHQRDVANEKLNAWREAYESLRETLDAYRAELEEQRKGFFARLFG